MSILNKLSNIEIDKKTKQELQHLELGMNQQDYNYIMKIQESYNITFDLLQEYFDKIKKAIIEIDGKEEADMIFKLYEKGEFPKHSITFDFADYISIERKFRYMNISLILHIFDYFSQKYNINEYKNRNRNYLFDNNEKYFKKYEKINYKVALKFLQQEYGFIPPQKEI